MTRGLFDLTGKTALITGGNRGIGLGMARALASANADVMIWGRSATANHQAVDEVSGVGAGRIRALEVDVSSEVAVIEAVTETVAAFGRIDSCFANAGVNATAPSFTEMSTDIWRHNLSVNLDGAFWTIRECVRHMVARAQAGDPGGSIVGIASLAAIEGAARNEAYAASKGALIALIKGVAVEHARFGVRANAILPGWIATDLTSGGQASEVFVSKVISRVPMRRWGEPEDFAGVAIYLASELSRFHTGDTLVVDGGYAIF